MNKENEITCPTGKVCFRTKAEIRNFIRVRNSIHGGKGYKYHYCTECGCWHLTTHTVQGDYMLKKHAKHYNRLEKKRIDRSIYELCGIAV